MQYLLNTEQLNGKIRLCEPFAKADTGMGDAREVGIDPPSSVDDIDLPTNGVTPSPSTKMSNLVRTLASSVIVKSDCLHTAMYYLRSREEWNRDMNIYKIVIAS